MQPREIVQTIVYLIIPYLFIVEWTINRTRLRGRGNLAPTGLVVLASALKCLLNSKLDYIFIIHYNNTISIYSVSLLLVRNEANSTQTGSLCYKKMLVELN